MSDPDGNWLKCIVLRKAFKYKSKEVYEGIVREKSH